MLIGYLKSIIIWAVILLSSAIVFGDNVMKHYGKYTSPKPEMTKVKAVTQFLAVAAIPLLRMLYVIVIIMLGMFDETRMRRLFGDEVVDEYVNRLKEKNKIED